ncbi:hypothetical protein EBQ93_00185 [bacterium]|nr:hypothetical protein [bacterium]
MHYISFYKKTISMKNLFLFFSIFYTSSLLYPSETSICIKPTALHPASSLESRNLLFKIIRCLHESQKRTYIIQEDNPQDPTKSKRPAIDVSE